MKQIKCVNLLTVIVVISGLLVGCGNENKNIASKVNENSYTQTKTNDSTNYEKYFAWDGNTLMLLMPDYEKEKKIVIPKKCERIESTTFSSNDYVEEVSFQDDKNVDGDKWTFREFTNLKKVTLPDNLTRINDRMFSYCSSLQTFTMPKAAETIGDFAFEYCDSLKEITIGESVKTIGKYAFQYDENLEKVTFNNNLEIIDEWAFDNCKALKEVRLNEGVKRIEGMVFNECNEIKEIYLPESIEYIDGTSFAQAVPHETTVYLKKGSYAEKSFNEDWGDDGLYKKEYY